MTDTLPGKPDRRILRSRSALREALLTLMASKPFNAITITEIVELANYNRGTFYTNYGSKEALLDDVIADLLDKLLQAFRAPYEQMEVFRVDELSAHSVQIFGHIYEHAAVYTVLMKSDVLQTLRDRMFAALKRISQEELVHADNGVDPDLQAAYSIHALLGLLFHWIEGGFKHSPAYMQDQLIKMINWRPTAARTSVRRQKSPIR